jgi:ribosome-associated protein YbcJ (S4-like RNA binding protein)
MAKAKVCINGQLEEKKGKRWRASELTSVCGKATDDGGVRVGRKKYRKV